MDASGHRDRPEAGYPNSMDIQDKGVPSGHYYHRNPRTKKFEVVREMPVGIPDMVLGEFDTFLESQKWVDENPAILTDSN